MSLPKPSANYNSTTLTGIEISYSVAGEIDDVAFTLVRQSYKPQPPQDEIAVMVSGFELAAGDYTGVLTVDDTEHANDSPPPRVFYPGDDSDCWH